MNIAHQLNQSKSKETHRFSKADRFPKPKQSPCISSSYHLPQNVSPGSKFSKSPRFKEKKSVSPSYYHNRSFTELNEGKGNKFSKSQRMKTQQIHNNGPGAYHYTQHEKSKSPSFFIGEKIKTHYTHWNQLGPGQYEEEIKPIKGFMVGKSQRFSQRQSQTPAPNSYKLINAEILSKYKQTHGPSFKGGNRLQQKKPDTPGPGSYAEFSQFSEGSQRIIQRLKRL